MEEEKVNPYHKEYGLFSNLWFTLCAMKKYAPLIIIMLPLGFILMPVQRYLWSFLSKYIIDLIYFSYPEHSCEVLAGNNIKSVKEVPIGKYDCKAPDKWDLWNCGNLVVIGNIFDNLDLMEVEEHE